MDTKEHRKRPLPTWSCEETPPPKLRKLQLVVPHTSAAVESLVAACRARDPVPISLTSWCFHGRRISSNVTLHITRCPNVSEHPQLHDLQEELRQHHGSALVVLQHGAGTYHEWIMRT